MLREKDWAPEMGAGTPAGALFDVIQKLHRAWRMLHTSTGMKHSNLMLLGAIWRLSEVTGKPVTVGKLAHMTHQSPPAVTQKVNELEQQGYVRRVAGKDDRRKVCILLTEAGQSQALEAMRHFARQGERALERLGPEKGETLVGLLYELCEALETVSKETQVSEGETAT